ncbi:hypothetical protein JKP88DRAFT_248132 [Tribonema minus]|uniref:Uncharacterized protein n=1 Tax=Tribonema minus TaxID=303371 RepID=A0A835YPX4_9STRA|nr:hypothetical protein JKP88DRAFT_248132 [Tribonema minus]
MTELLPATASGNAKSAEVVWEGASGQADYLASGVSGLKACTLSDGQVCLAGGDPRLYPRLLVSILVKNRWVNVDAASEGQVPTCRCGHALVSGPTPSTFVVFGGQTASASTNEAYMAHLTPGLERLSWRLLGTNPQPIAAVPEKAPPKGKRASATAAAAAPDVVKHPAPRAWHAACIAKLDGARPVLLVHGGIGADSGILNDLWCFDFEQDRWHELQPAGAAPPALCHHTLSAVEDGQRVVLCGGFDGKVRQKTVAVLSLSSMTWTLTSDTGLPPICMHTAVVAPAAAALDSAPPPAAADAPSTAAAAAAAQAAKPRAPLWTTGQGTPPTDHASTAPAAAEVVVKTAVYIIGGVTGCDGQLSADVLALTAAGTVAKVCASNEYAHADAAAPRCGAAATLLGASRLLICGGAGAHGTRLRDCRVLNLSAEQGSAHGLTVLLADESSGSLAPAEEGDEQAAAAAAAPPPPRLELPNGDVYTGAVNAAGQREGSGTCAYASGDSYAGAWSADAPHGRGKMVFASSSSGGGGAERCGSAGGSAAARLPPLAQYSGEWDRGVIHGLGEAVFATAAAPAAAGGASGAGASACAAAAALRSYSGDWERGVPSGQGGGAFCNGSEYVGRWAEGAPHGRGQLTLGGSVFQGDWERGELHRGTQDTPKWRYEGGFRALLREGEGRCDYADGSVYMAAACDAEKRRAAQHHPQRCVQRAARLQTWWLVNSNSSVCAHKHSPKLSHPVRCRAACAPPTLSRSGAWRSGRANGQGEHRGGVTREVYRGKFVGGERCGAGTCAYPCGDTFEGLWRGGAQHGAGRLRRANGSIEERDWTAG